MGQRQRQPQDDDQLPAGPDGSPAAQPADRAPARVPAAPSRSRASSSTPPGCADALTGIPCSLKQQFVGVQSARLTALVVCAAVLLIGASVLTENRTRHRQPAEQPAQAPNSDAAAGEQYLQSRNIISPIEGLRAGEVHDIFNEVHNGHVHEAIDIMEPRYTPVRAVDDGVIQKLFRSKAGGNTIYQFDPGGQLAYYYAHLDGYAPGIQDGVAVQRGQIIGYVGSTGNADPNAPHLHFAVFVLGPEKQWWRGAAIDPYNALKSAAEAHR